ncbi:MAG: EcsC family protein [Ruminococcaceae bacterium]|nr:EcsC family protein [Oscillospiraceae bacterium]
MQLPKFRTPLQKEWDKLIKQEAAFLSKKAQKQQSKLNTLLESKVPQNLQATLDNAFAKAFGTVFEKGTDIIEKTYSKDKADEAFFINNTLAAKKRPSRKALKSFNKNAGKTSGVNLAVSTAAGVGLGVLGIGIPDIVLFVSLVLKSLYQIAASYGKNYRFEEERKFILLLIQGAVTFGREQLEIDREIDHYIEYNEFSTQKTIPQLIEETSKCLSSELLYMKFLQGVPIVGAVGGAYDFVYMSQINTYAKMKYYKRFLSDKMYGL